MDVDRIKSELYEQGKTEQALQEISKALSESVTEPALNAELHALAAWCEYRRGNFVQAIRRVGLAGTENKSAKRCLLYIRAYGPTKDPSVADDEELVKLVKELGADIDARNALVIRARQALSQVDHNTIWQHAQSLLESGEPAKHDVKLANLCHNAARFFLDKARGRTDLTIALGLFQVAELHYGRLSHWHHRAALNHWRAKTFLQLNALPEALSAASQSLQIWTDQLSLDPNNEVFQDKTVNAITLVTTVCGKIREGMPARAS